MAIYKVKEDKKKMHKDQKKWHCKHKLQERQKILAQKEQGRLLAHQNKLKRQCPIPEQTTSV